MPTEVDQPDDADEAHPPRQPRRVADRRRPGLEELAANAEGGQLSSADEQEAERQREEPEPDVHPYGELGDR
jgi:hypothetical protein